MASGRHHKGRLPTFFFPLFLLTFALFPSVIHAQAGSGLTNANLTTCGRSCLSQTLALYSCPLGNTTCQCIPSLWSALSLPCLEANCTMADTLRLYKVQASVCDLPSESKAGSLVGGSLFILLLVLTFGTLRIWGKKIAGLLSWDDAVIAFAGGLAVVTTAMVAWISCRGWGRHMWDLEEGELVLLMRGFFISQCLFPFVLGFVKISILLFYLSIFPVRTLHVACWAIIAFTAAATVVTFVLSVVECNPVSAYWDKNRKPFTCMAPYVLNTEGAVTGVVQDLAIFLLPAWQVWRLQIKRRQKILVMIMFGIGSIGCIAAIARLAGIFTKPTLADPSWSLNDYSTWSGVELCVGYSCACLPTVRRLLGRVFPRLLGTTADKSASDPPTGPSHGHSKSGSHTVALELSNRRSLRASARSVPPEWDRIPDEENILPTVVERHETKN